MHPILFKIGFLSFKTYGFFLALSFLSGYFLLLKKITREGFASNEEVNKLFLWIIISGIAGARILYVIAEGGFDSEHPLAALRLWEGGLHYFGGLVGAILSVVAFRLRHPSFKIWRFADAAAPSLALGLAIGKLGCFSAGCCYGIPSEFPSLSVTFTDPDSLAVRGMPLVPVQLCESLTYAVIFFASQRAYSLWHSRREGEIFWWTVMFLSAARFALEFLRWDKKIFLGLHAGGLLSAFFVGVSVVFIFLIRKKRTAALPPADNVRVESKKQ